MYNLSLLFFQSWIQFSRLSLQWLLWFNDVMCNASDIAIITVKNVDYGCIVDQISKSEAINLLKISVFENHGYIY